MKTLIILFLINYALALPRLDPLVQTKRGLIRGVQAPDGDYAMFMGIPYAKINDTNRFGAALPYPDFEDTFLANDDSAICIQNQARSTEVIGSLDCLRLNVYVPNTASSREKLPVLLWIHGGRFHHGNGGRRQFGPKYLVKQNVILVTINYRVGLYGFMCLDTAEVPGNQALKDQLRAMRWVKENIEDFGGDDSRITIFGSSAGGVSVDYHLLSKHEKLFDKAITQSGTSLAPWAFLDSDRSVPVRIASQLGAGIEDSDEAVKYLSTVDPKSVMLASNKLSLTFRPCVEKEFDGVESFLTEYPVNKPMPKAKDTPVLIGYNNLEKLFEYANKHPDDYDARVFENSLALGFNSLDEDSIRFVRNYYIGDEAVTVDRKYELAEFDSDHTFIHPIHRSVSKYVENGGTVFYYVFKYGGGRNYAKMRDNITVPGAIHSDEKGYLFDMAILTEPPTPEDQAMIDKMTTMWTNFVKYGDPTPETSELLTTKWIPVTNDAMNYLVIDSEQTMKRRPAHARMAFWDLFYETNKQNLKGYRNIEL